MISDPAVAALASPAFTLLYPLSYHYLKVGSNFRTSYECAASLGEGMHETVTVHRREI